MVHGRQLVCLDPTGGDDPDWYKNNHYGKLPSKEQTGSVDMDFVVKQPGMCCTIGCVRTHDTAFSPCGHTVCCWDCLNEIKAKHGRCPVCNVEIQETFLCYEPRGEFEF